MPGQPHIRVRANGTIGSVAAPYEIFSYGFSLGAQVMLSPPAQLAVQDILVDYHSSAGAGISTQGVLREVAISLMGADHKQIGETVRLTDRQVTGLGGAAKYPSQIAYRVSTGTGTRGRSNRGGWYVPVPGLGISSPDDPRLSVVAQQAALLAATQVVERCSIEAAQMVIASQILGNVTVREVRVGRVFDTVRSRRNAMPEDYLGAEAII